MHIEFTAPRDEVYARRLFWRTSRRLLIWQGFLAFAFALFGAGSVVSGHETAMLSGFASIALALCLGIGLWRGVGRAVAQLPPEWHEPRTYVVTDERVSWHSEHASASYSWALVAKVREEPYAFMLLQKGNHAMWDVPSAGMTEEQREEFRQFARQRTAPPPPRTEEVAVTEAGTSRLRPPAPGGR